MSSLRGFASGFYFASLEQAIVLSRQELVN